ncbi:putative pre-mRNA-splicing factor ATP-dependent RNA helicase dhx16, partial [Nowakowskiella sp. JEL0078]
MAQLPISPYKKSLIDAIREFSFLAIIGDTGSGKTTQIPQFVLDDFTASDIRRIAVTQPRRIAAISAAKRVAAEQRCRLGSRVGYKIRFEKNVTPPNPNAVDKFSEDALGSRLIYMTDGVLLRECVADPLLLSYDLVILDEAHERSLETDVLFGLLKRACRLRIAASNETETSNITSQLKVLVMSATLDVEKFSDFFDQCP